MCWSPKVKTPAVTAQVAAPTPAINNETPKGVVFGDDNLEKGKETKGVKSLTITPNTETSNSETKSTTLGSTSVGANTGFAGASVSKKLKAATATKKATV